MYMCVLGLIKIVEYNWQVIADPSLSLKQRSLVSDSARALDKAKMMRFDEKSGNFYCTELGRIASHFYIQYSSVETYNEMLKRHMNDSEVIDYRFTFTVPMLYGQFNRLFSAFFLLMYLSFFLT